MGFVNDDFTNKAYLAKVTAFGEGDQISFYETIPYGGLINP